MVYLYAVVLFSLAFLVLLATTWILDRGTPKRPGSQWLHYLLRPLVVISLGFIAGCITRVEPGVGVWLFAGLFLLLLGAHVRRGSRVPTHLTETLALCASIASGVLLVNEGLTGLEVRPLATPNVIFGALKGLLWYGLASGVVIWFRREYFSDGLGSNRN